MNTLMTDIELAEALTVSRNTIRNWHQSGTITAAIHEPGVLRFDLDAVKKSLSKRAAKKSPVIRPSSTSTQMVPTR